MKPRVLVIVGTRPEAIKMAPVMDALRRRSDALESALALTGQHTTLVDQVLETFALEPTWDLGIMKEGQDLYDVAHGCLDGVRGVLQEFEPDLVLVQGDTATVFFAGLVSFFERTRVGHVEAGLRSGDKWAPFPEEIFRRLTDQVTDFYFAPTAGARDHLRAEGIADASIFVTGNTVVDALHTVGRTATGIENDQARAVVDTAERLVLLTAHRRESFGAPLQAVFGAVRELVRRHPGLEVLYPVHPNPNVREAAQEILGPDPAVHLVDPLSYLDLVQVLKTADLVLTDSGGIQEEAPAFDVPVLVLRDVTERPEGVEAGVAWLVGTDPEAILREGAARLAASGQGSPPPNPYGDGQAGERIADIAQHVLTGAPRTTQDWRPVPIAPAP